RLCSDAGVRFTVRCRRVSSNPEYRAAARRRSFASCKAWSGTPSKVRHGNAFPISDSPVTSCTCIPLSATLNVLPILVAETILSTLGECCDDTIRSHPAVALRQSPHADLLLRPQCLFV